MSTAIKDMKGKIDEKRKRAATIFAQKNPDGTFNISPAERDELKSLETEVDDLSGKLDGLVADSEAERVNAEQREALKSKGLGPMRHSGANANPPARTDDPNLKSLGQHFVQSDGYGEVQKRRQTFSIGMDVDKSAIKTTFAAGANSLTSIAYQPGIVLLNQQRLTVSDLVSQGTTNGTTIRYRQETSFTNAATTVAEGGTKPQGTLVINEVDAQVKKIAVVQKVTMEMFEDYAATQSYVDNRLMYMVGLTEEQQVLNGNGTGANLKGIMATSGVQTTAVTAGPPIVNGPDAIFTAMTKVRSVGFFEPDGMVIHPLNWQTLRLMKDGQNQYYGGGPFTGAYGNGPFVTAERFWGVPVVITTSIAQGTALVGAFKIGAQIFRKDTIGIESTNSNDGDFNNNLISLRCEERLALCVYTPLSFCTVTALT